MMANALSTKEPSGEASVSVATLVPASVAARLTELAKASGTGRADLIRTAVLRYLAEETRP